MHARPRPACHPTTHPMCLSGSAQALPHPSRGAGAPTPPAATGPEEGPGMRSAGALTSPQPFIPPALREQAAGAFLSSPPPATLERWAVAYGVMAAHARELGVPASAIPPLPAGASASEVAAARERLEGLLASFLSAGL